jgi:hypothetical protein
MNDIITQLQNVRQLVLTRKHLPGQHNQGDHTPKAYGKGNGDVDSYTVIDPDGGAHTVYKVKAGGDISSDLFPEDQTGVVYNNITDTWHIGKYGDTMHEDLERGVERNDVAKYRYAKEEIMVRGYLNMETGSIELYDFSDVAETLGHDPKSGKYVAKKYDRALTRAFDNGFSVNGHDMNVTASKPHWL